MKIINFVYGFFLFNDAIEITPSPKPTNHKERTK